MGSLRAYDSSLRKRQALQTREVVVAAAFELFSKRGFARTTVGDIAAAAGVSVETVQKYGPKKDLLKAALLPAIFGGTEDGDILEADFFRRAMGIAEPRLLVTFLAGVYAEANRQSHGIWRAWATAALDDPGLTGEWQAKMVEIRDDFVRAVELIGGRGWLRPDVPPEEIASSAWMLTLPEVYERMTGQAGMTHDAYVSWLTRMLCETLFGIPIDATGASNEK